MLQKNSLLNLLKYKLFFSGKKPYGYKSKYGKKPMNEEEPEDNMEDGDWEEDTEENWEE